MSHLSSKSQEQRSCRIDVHEVVVTARACDSSNLLGVFARTRCHSVNAAMFFFLAFANWPNTEGQKH
jgi:hypothetical protein